MILNGNKILITGGCSGIGLALARAFLNLDNTVIVCDYAKEKIEEVRKSDPRLHILYCDVTNPDDTSRLKKDIEKQFGGINFLVNNAGSIDRISFTTGDFDHRELEKHAKTNLVAPFALVKLFLPMLMAQKQPAIINIGSALAYVPRPITPFYCATKAGVHSATKSLRVQLSETPVKVFEVLPPTVDTEMTKHSKVIKISTTQLAEAVVKGLLRNRAEIAVGYTPWLALACRIAPKIMDKVAASKYWEKK